MGKLYICPTPIGNLKDLTFRTLEVFQAVDLIAAEDTRRTIKLLNHYEIKKPMTSYHEHNKREKAGFLLEKLEAGESIALVSDAGMPGISDPGADLVAQALELGLDVEVLPGATASILALVLSGLDTRKFVFEGFLAPKRKQRLEELEAIKSNSYTSIIYESPYRIKDCLEDMAKVFPDRRLSISRELTKKHEETLRGSVRELLDLFSKREIRGEFVLVLEGNQDQEGPEEIGEEDLEEILRELIASGLKKSAAVKKVSQEYGIPKNQVYKISLKL